ncbi:hypothetical protein Dimus_009769 [Dionaea muscipula]
MSMKKEGDIQHAKRGPTDMKACLLSYLLPKASTDQFFNNPLKSRAKHKQESIGKARQRQQRQRQRQSKAELESDLMDRKNKILRQLRISLIILKRAFLLLRAVSFFSMLFFSSLLAFLFINFVRDRVSSSTWLLGFSGRRSYMFLLCNGILVILVFFSSFSPSPPTDDGDQHVDGKKKHSFEKGCQGRDDQQMITLLPRLSQRKQLDAGKEEEEEDKVEDGYRLVHRHQLCGIEQEEEIVKAATQTVSYSEENEHPVTQSSYDDQLTCKIVQEDEMAAAAEEGAGDEWCSLSTDELNRRCEDFIKKMKEEIKSEQRRWSSISFGRADSKTVNPVSN